MAFSIPNTLQSPGTQQANAAIGSFAAQQQAMRNQGINPNLYSTFQQNIAGQSVNNLASNLANITNQARSGNYATGVGATLKRQATEDEQQRLAMQQFQGFKAFQELGLRNQTAQRAQQLAGSQALAQLAAQREAQGFQNQMNLLNMQNQREIARQQMAAQNQASEYGLIGNLVGGITNAAGGIAKAFI